jgi:hypothetical protein
MHNDLLESNRAVLLRSVLHSSSDAPFTPEILVPAAVAQQTVRRL